MKGKRLLTLLCAIALLVSCTPDMGRASAGKALPNLYTRINPATGKTYDLNGKNVYFYDYWTGADWHDLEPGTDKEVTTYKYRKWLEKTYNCHIYQVANGDWMTCATVLADFVANPTDDLCTFVVEPGKMYQVIQNNLAADWTRSVSVNLSDSKWNRSTIRQMTFGSRVLGVSTGYSEPRQCLFFNKRVLEEAGIDWNTLYDMQKAGTWTWSKFRNLLSKLTRDTDNDGVNDIYGLIGSSDDFYRVAVFSNGGSFFDIDSSGKLKATVTGKKSKDALAWATETWSQHCMPTPEGANWDWYKDAWKQGYSGFYMYQCYGGFNEYSEMSDMEDPWGCVAFPKGPEGSDYVTIVSNNVTVIPSIYSKEEISQISMLYDLWTSPAPELQDEEEDDLTALEGKTDERAIYETYAMLRDSEHGTMDKTELLGTVNDILGIYLLWGLNAEELDDLIEIAALSWEEYLEEFNRLMAEQQAADAKLTKESGGLVLRLDPSDNTAVVTGAKKKSVTSLTIPATFKVGKKTYKITAIAEKAFKGLKKLAKVTIGKNVKTIGKDAFNGCVLLKTVSGGSGLVVIGDGAFSGCKVLASFTLNSKVASIGDKAFYNCKKLKTITVKTTKLTGDVIGKNAFGNIYSKATITCPKSKLTKYAKLFKSKGAPKTVKYK